jgi:uncharacterized Ntn-hydrolase superfamily protein
MKSGKLFTTKIFVLIFAVLLSAEVFPQDTFSIVAVDTITGEIGSAGASCVGPFGGVGAFILSDVIEGIGAIHTQASWHAINQQNAHNRMLEGLSPQQIIDWLVANDVQGNPHIRQYGIVDLTRNGESAAYTGVNCLDYKNHVTGPGYAVQGNILLGQIIVDTMQTMYLLTSGEPLADRLMKTLQAAKIIGADTRCAVRGTSSQSGFVKVVRIGDGGIPYLQIVVPDTPVGLDPIDSLQAMFDNWKASLFTVVDPFLSEISVDEDSIPADGTSDALITISPKNNSDTLLASGLEIILTNSGDGTLSSVTDPGNGTYLATLTSSTTIGTDTISAKVISGSDTVTLFNKIVVHYVTVVSVEEDLFPPEKFYLYQNFPQPFNSITKIKFTVPVLVTDNPLTGEVRVTQSQMLTLKVYDLLGNEIAALVNEDKPAGTYEVEFNGTDFPSAVYFYQLQSGTIIQTKKMILLK